MRDRGVQKIIRKHLTEAGIMGVNVRSLRHTFGTHHVAKGTSLKTIQEDIGLKDPRSTSLYIFLAKDLVGRELQEHAL